MKVKVIAAMVLLISTPAFAVSDPKLVKVGEDVNIEYGTNQTVLFLHECYKNPVSFIKNAEGDFEMTWEVDLEGCEKLRNRKSL